MRLKKFGALFLAGAMMTGTIGVMSPTQVKAAVTPANTYTMTVPANVNIEKPGWNSLGNIQISGPVGSLKKVTVTATTTNGFELKNPDGKNSVSYTMKTEENGSEQTSFEFDAASINADGGASKEIGVDVGDLAGTPVGTYTDTIQFTGTMSEGLAWSEDDGLRIGLEDGTYEYSVFIERIGSFENSVPCRKFKIVDDGSDSVDFNFDLKKDGNVFTFTYEDFGFTLDFSDQTCSIQGDSSCHFTFVGHFETSTKTPHVWLDTRPQ